MTRKPTHPGIVFKEDVMIPLGLSVTEAAKRLGISRKQLSLFINEKASLSPEMAFRIAEATGTSVQSWMAIQTKLSVWKANQNKPKNVAKESLVLTPEFKKALFEVLEDLYDIKVADEAYAAYLADPETVSMDEIKKKHGV